MPTVSICIPTYNQTEYLEKTLLSILDQNFTDYEIIITDDSTDDSVEKLINKYNFNSKLKYFKNTERLGSPQNWNCAISKAQGKYIKIMHHDEWFNYSDSLLKFVDLINNDNTTDFAFSAVRGFNIEENHKWIHKPTNKQLKELVKNPNILFFGNFIGSPSNIIFRNKDIELFDNNLIWCVDFEFYIRLITKNNNIGYISEDLVTSVSSAEHQITTYVVNNKKIQVFEYLYLYNKIKPNIKIIQIGKYITFIQKLFKKYQINTITDINECGFYQKLPFIVKFICLINNLKNGFKKVY